MISIKSKKEIGLMKKAGEISALALEYSSELIQPGVSTAFIDKKVCEFIKAHGAKPSFLGYGGFPASICSSVNNVVIHGVPSRDVLVKDGDIISIDVGACFQGYHGDNAATFPVGKISERARQLLAATHECLIRGIKAAIAGNRLGDVGYAIQNYAESQGFSVVTKFVGHGIGKKMHEDPNVPNYGTPGRGVRLQPGMTLAIEPMINEKGSDVSVASDGTVLTKDGGLSAHFEKTILVTSGEPMVLTPWRI